MSLDFAVYDRDRNADGNIQSASFVPEYGSKVSFEYVNPYLYTADNHYKVISKNLNNTSVRFSLKFTNRPESEANSFLHLFEEVNASGSGHLHFNTNVSTASGVEIAFPTGTIYKNLSGLLIEDYNFNYHDALFDVNLNLLKNNFSYFFDWSGSSYLDVEKNVKTGWAPGTNYEKFDIVWFPKYLTGSGQGRYYTTVNRIEKFYYCNSGHKSTVKNSPTGITGDVWSQDFFFSLDDGIDISTDRQNSIFKTKDSFSIYNKINANEGLITDLPIQLKNRSNKETFSILHFAEKHENMRPFELSLPQLYTKKKFFIIKSLEHSFVYKDCNDINITVSEVVKYKKDYYLDSFSSESFSPGYGY